MVFSISLVGGQIFISISAVKLFWFCHPQSISEIMRKLGSPPPGFSSLIMLGILLHKLSRHYGAVSMDLRFDGREKSEPCLFVW